MMRLRLLSLLTVLLSGCSFYREQLGSYYAVSASSKAITERAIISLIREGTLQSRLDLWQRLIEKKAAAEGVSVTGRWIDNAYMVGHRNRKSFVLFHSPSRTFYSFDFCNCGTPVVEPEGLVGPNCDLRISSISELQPDSVLRLVEWQDAGPALTAFKKSILPLIRRRAAEPEKQRP